MLGLPTQKPEAPIYEKEAMVSKLKEEFAALLATIEERVGQTPLHEVEGEVLHRLLQIGSSCVDFYLADCGTGYDRERPPRAADGAPLTFKGIVKSPYVSIFGEVTIRRAAYASEGQGYVYPLDVQLNLPASEFSYLVQQEVLARGVETDFRDAVGGVNDRLALGLGPSMPQRLCAEVSAAADPFYAQIPAPAPETEGTHLLVSADGKGVRILKTERLATTVAEECPKARRGKGDKPGIKKQAVVTVDASFTPVCRTPEEVVQALLRERPLVDQAPAPADGRKRRDTKAPKPREAVHTHRRATLAGKDAAMEALMDRVGKRDPTGTKPLVVLLDGDPSLEAAVQKAFRKAHLTDRAATVILDIIHVSEYVWEVGTALHGETSPARLGWVREHLLALLESWVDEVIAEFQQTLTAELRPAQQHALEKASTYFENHRHMMNYATYLANGYPIATGVVEGTCNSLVKDRMEQSGMRWSIAGAQAVLDLRAVKQNHDWEAFWRFHIASEEKRLYRKASNADSYPMAA